MIAYTLKHVLELVPEALDLVKQAQVEQEYPISNRDSCIASALSIAYHQSAGNKVDLDVMTKVANAVEAYGLKSTVEPLHETLLQRSRELMVKQASAPTQEQYITKVAAWEGGLSGFKDIPKLVEEATELVKQAEMVGSEVPEDLQRYGGQGILSKKAALDALSSRFYLTKNDTFVKIAAALGSEGDYLRAGKLSADLCRVVTQLDKQAHLDMAGFDFYKEAVLTKEAAMSGMMANVAGKSYPMSRITSLPESYVNDYLGPDFMKEVRSDPVSAKALVESLPRDSQNVLATILKNAG